MSFKRTKRKLSANEVRVKRHLTTPPVKECQLKFDSPIAERWVLNVYTAEIIWLTLLHIPQAKSMFAPHSSYQWILDLC